MLEFIGTGSALNTKLGNNSAFYKKYNSLFLIDCGSTTFSRIQRYNILDGIKHIYVAITHTHPDHIASLGDLIFYCHYILNEHVTLLTPDMNNIIQLLDLMGVEKSLYNIIQLDKEYHLDNKEIYIKISYYNVSHVENIMSFGYILDNNNCKVYYSGDSNVINQDVLNMFNNGNIDKLYQDTCSTEYENNPHLSFAKLCAIIKPEFRNKVYCMHLNESFDVLEAKKNGFNVAESIFNSIED